MKYLITLMLLLVSCGGQSPSVIEYPCSTSTNGTQVTVSCPDGSRSVFNNTFIVQFCPGVVSYPTVFPESGLCIQNKLYGVFWMSNSAWLGEIPPGNYTSTSTSLACNFKVLVNCGVQN